MIPFLEEADIAVTVCDTEGNILDLNQQSREVNQKPGQDLVGQNILDCHPEPARTKLLQMMQHQVKNVYTIEKKGKKKLIYQIPWYKDGEYAGFVELSMVIPFDMPHKVRG